MADVFRIRKELEDLERQLLAFGKSCTDVGLVALAKQFDGAAQWAHRIRWSLEAAVEVDPPKAVDRAALDKAMDELVACATPEERAALAVLVRAWFEG